MAPVPADAMPSASRLPARVVRARGVGDDRRGLHRHGTFNSTQPHAHFLGARCSLTRGQTSALHTLFMHAARPRDAARTAL